VTRRAIKRLLVLGSLLLALGGAGLICCNCVALAPHPEQSAFSNTGRPPEPREIIVQLRCAKVPWTPAVHCWFAEFDPTDDRWHRWEVWQTAGEGGTNWGHLRKDHQSPADGVGDGPSWALAEWRGPEADRLRAALHSPEDYPYPQAYSYWPGPNCNTYVAWIFKRAGVPYDLPFGAIGKGY
jgi:hypothetical protein